MSAIVKPLGLPLGKYGLIKATLKGDLRKAIFERRVDMLRLIVYKNFIKKYL